MSLADELNKLNEENEQRDNEQVDYPSSHLKNRPLAVDRRNPTLHVRILPAVSPTANTWEPYRELWVTNDKGKKFQYILDPDTNSETDPLMQAVNRWSKVTIGVDSQGNKKSGLYKLDSKYGSYPALRYYLNVVPLEVYKDDKGIAKYREKKDNNGNLDVCLLSINNTLLNLLATQLRDEMLNPNTINQKYIPALKKRGYNFTDDDLANSFISSVFAYPVTFTYVKQEKSVIRNLAVDSSSAHMLMPLPNDWQSQAEDLAYQTTPSYKYNSHWVGSLINKYDSELGLSHVEAPKQDPFPEKKVQATAPTVAQPTKDSTVAVGTPNATSKIEYGTEGVYQVGSIFRDDDDDNDTPKSNTSNDNVVDATFPNLDDLASNTSDSVAKENPTSKVDNEPKVESKPKETATTEPVATSTNDSKAEDSKEKDDVDDLIKSLGLDNDDELLK